MRRRPVHIRTFVVVYIVEPDPTQRARRIYGTRKMTYGMAQQKLSECVPGARVLRFHEKESEAPTPTERPIAESDGAQLLLVPP